ncbi:hypothetical protein Tco_1100011 [Tanacetum coccineum]
MSDAKMGLDVADTLCFQLGGVRRRMTWRQFILELGLHTEPEMAEAGFGVYWASSDRVIPDKGDLRGYWIEISHARGRKSGVRLSGGHFIGRLAAHFGLVSDEGLRGLQVATAGAHEADEAGLAVDEGDQEVPAPAQAPLPPPPAPQP